MKLLVSALNVYSLNDTVRFQKFPIYNTLDGVKIGLRVRHLLYYKKWIRSVKALYYAYFDLYQPTYTDFKTQDVFWSWWLDKAWVILETLGKRDVCKELSSTVGSLKQNYI